MNGSYPVDVGLLYDRWLVGVRHIGKLRLGVNQVYLSQKLVRLKNLGHVGPHLVAEHGQDADNLAALLGL